MSEIERDRDYSHETVACVRLLLQAPSCSERACENSNFWRENLSILAASADFAWQTFPPLNGHDQSCLVLMIFSSLFSKVLNNDAAGSLSYAKQTGI